MRGEVRGGGRGEVRGEGQGVRAGRAKQYYLHTHTSLHNSAVSCQHDVQIIIKQQSLITDITNVCDLAW